MIYKKITSDKYAAMLADDKFNDYASKVGPITGKVFRPNSHVPEEYHPYGFSVVFGVDPYTTYLIYDGESNA